MPITFTLSPFQLVCCIVVTFGAVALSYVLGRDDGRRREAAEPSQRLVGEEEEG